MLLPHQDDKKKVASIIVGSISKSKDKSAPAEESEGPEIEDDSSVGGEAVAEDILRAIHGRDAKGLFELLKHLVSMVDDDSGEEAEEAE